MATRKRLNLPYNGYAQPPEPEEEAREGAAAQDDEFYVAQAAEMARRAAEWARANPVKLHTLHKHELPCLGCSAGIRNGELVPEDFCQFCAHFHVEDECPLAPYDNQKEGVLWNRKTRRPSGGTHEPRIQ